MLVHNYNKKSKFQPIFSPDQYIITEIADHGRKLSIERESDGKTLIRHPDDLKTYKMPNDQPVKPKVESSDPWKLLEPYENYTPPYNLWFDNGAQNHPQPHNNIPPNIAAEAPQVVAEVPPAVIQPEQQVRRSGRETRPPERMGVQIYDEHQPLRGEEAVIPPWWPGFPRE